MAITFKCQCGKTLKVRDELAGRKGKCPACGNVLVVPGKMPGIEELPTKRRRKGEPRMGLAIATGVVVVVALCFVAVGMVFWRRTPESRVGRAYKLMEQGEPRQARVVLKEVLAEKPDHVKALHLLAECYMATDELKPAMEAIVKAAKAKPDDALIQYDLGTISIELGDKKNAYAAYKALKGLDDAMAAEILERIKTTFTMEAE